MIRGNCKKRCGADFHRRSFGCRWEKTARTASRPVGWGWISANDLWAEKRKNLLRAIFADLAVRYLEPIKEGGEHVVCWFVLGVDRICNEFQAGLHLDLVGELEISRCDGTVRSVYSVDTNRRSHRDGRGIDRHRAVLDIVTGRSRRQTPFARLRCA